MGATLCPRGSARVSSLCERSTERAALLLLHHAAQRRQAPRWLDPCRVPPFWGPPAGSDPLWPSCARCHSIVHAGGRCLAFLHESEHKCAVQPQPITQGTSMKHAYACMECQRRL